MTFATSNNHVAKRWRKSVKSIPIRKHVESNVVGVEKARKSHRNNSGRDFSYEVLEKPSKRGCLFESYFIGLLSGAIE